MWIVAGMVVLAVTFYLMARNWETGRQRPQLKGKPPLVSILIATYNSENTIENTLKSIQEVDYPRKEVIVVNDSQDRTPEICERYGVKCIQNNQRQGKPASLNQAVKEARGEILCFIDSDTVLEEDALEKAVPWFERKDVGAVQPRYGVENDEESIISRLTSLDSYFISNLFKTHMSIGSLLSMRGCSVLVRRSAFEEIGGFEETLTEDTEAAARLQKAGYKIQYEPEAVTRTEEPSTVKGLKDQRFRWGKGATYSFFRHYRFYLKNPQFLAYFLPYLLFFLAVGGVVLFHTSAFLVPLFSLYVLYTFSLKNFLLIGAVLILPFMSTVATNVTAGSIAHMFILTFPESNDSRDMLLIIPYIFFYLPTVMLFYLAGLISAVRNRRKGKPELDFSDWK